METNSMTPNKQKLNGSHLMLDCFGCPTERLDSPENVKSFLASLPEKLGMKKLIEPYIARYDGEGWDRGGITGFILIAERYD